jgi:AcrR family transcriptional regulator
MTPRPTRDQSSSRSRLLQAAKRLFALQGYEQTATSAIAREAGTSESQLMRYFGGKVGLLDALFNDAWLELNERVRKVVREAATSRDAIVNVLQLIAGSLARDPDLATLFLFEGRRLRGDTPRVRLSEGFQAFADIVKGLVKKAQADREIDPRLDAGAVASAMMGACESMIRDRAVARAAGSRTFAEREIKRTLDAMIAGFSGRPAKAVRTARGTRARQAS